MVWCSEEQSTRAGKVRGFLKEPDSTWALGDGEDWTRDWAQVWTALNEQRSKAEQAEKYSVSGPHFVILSKPVGGLWASLLTSVTLGVEFSRLVFPKLRLGVNYIRIIWNAF